ncbi:MULTISPECIES: DUF2790 domain-containing protein [Pseudomonas]|uniref:DUF2790 domain-containing protein n=1 Tax=Pseudomonas TaxID=286 RepID=UPI000CFD616C|nr:MULTISPECIES: DUF2790 domain-containing protein [Pseudomonas]PQZ87662.1 hypothetical protein CQ048_20330 [Pseudomonas trivialis]PRB23596.1 hypothetical protein CQ041_20590 [Pseudomonas sp. MYb60]
MKALIIALAALLSAGPVLAAEPVIHDQTGFFVHMDVAKVLSSTDTFGQCGLVPVRFDYLDHQGREHVLDYKVYATGCPGGN